MTCPPRRQMRQHVQRSESWEDTDLGLSEDGEEQIHGNAVDRPRSDHQQRAHGEKGRGLYEHGGDGLVQSADSSRISRSGANAPGMQDESDDNHEGEDDVE